MIEHFQLNSYFFSIAPVTESLSGQNGDGNRVYLYASSKMLINIRFVSNYFAPNFINSFHDILLFIYPCLNYFCHKNNVNLKFWRVYIKLGKYSNCYINSRRQQLFSSYSLWFLSIRLYRTWFSTFSAHTSTCFLFVILLNLY